MRSAITRCRSKVSRSSARPVTKCMWQRTRHRNSSQRAKSLNSSAVNRPAFDELLRLADAIDVFGDPEQGVEVAQAALAVLDVRLDEIARRAGLGDAGVALPQLRIDELGRRGRARSPCRSAATSVLEERPVAEQEARLQQRGADRHVGLRPRAGTPRPSASRGRPSASGPRARRASPRRRSRSRRSACRAAGTGDRRPSPAPGCRGRSRRSPRRRGARRVGRIGGRIEVTRRRRRGSSRTTRSISVGEAARAGEAVLLGDELPLPPPRRPSSSSRRSSGTSRPRRAAASRDRLARRACPEGSSSRSVIGPPRCDRERAGLSPCVALETTCHLPVDLRRSQFHDRNSVNQIVRLT